MAHHRVADGKNSLRRRGVSRGLVFMLLAVLLVASSVVVWLQVGDHVGREGDAAAASCGKGAATVAIIADPDIAEGLSAIAKSYSETHPVIRDHCITIAVRPGDAKITLEGLAGTWDPQANGQYPAAWIPQSSVWAADLVTARPSVVDGTPESLVTSPVVLATSPELGAQLTGKLDWAQLPTLARRDDSLTEFGLRGWGSLRMAMPTGAQSDASALAAQAVAMRITRTTGVLTAVDASSKGVAAGIGALTEAAPRSPDGTPVGAATAIADAADAKAAPIHAVPITEQRLFQLTKADTTAKLAEVLPSGPTPLADYPFLKLTGDQVPEYAATAVADFFRFAEEPDHLAVLTALGFRGDAPMPVKTPTVTFPVTPNPMASPETAAVVDINRLVFGPAS
ncbi:hypothetical protein [Gordonia sp. NPDC003376]